MNEGYWERTVDSLAAFLPNLIGALAVLIIGTIIAWIIAALVRWAFSKTRLDDKLSNWLRGERGGPAPNSEKWVGRVVFWVLMLFVLIGVFQALDAPAISDPLNRLLTIVVEFIPKLIGAALLLGLAWLIATAVRTLVVRGLRAANIDERLNRHLPERETPPATETTPVTAAPRRVDLAKSLGDAAYWLVFLLFLPMILGVLDLEGLLEPVTDMVEKVLAFLPNLLMAAIILVVGWFIARVVRNVVAGLLAAAGVDRFAQNAGLSPARMRYSVSEMLAWIVYILILVPVIVMALEALRVETITRPAVAMLNDVMVAIPRLFAAAVLLFIAWVVGKLVANLIGGLLGGFGFDRMLANLGLVQQAGAAASGAMPGEARTHLMRIRTSPSQVVGYVVLVAIMLFAIAEALRLLEFNGLANLVLGFLIFLGNVVVGLIIIAIGLAVAKIAAQAVRDSRVQEADLLARVARVAIIVFAVAMGLQQMGIASSIINLAFALILGSAAVAAAIAFGIGGRDVAKRQVEKWAQRVERPEIVGPGGGMAPPPPPPPSVPPTDSF